MLKCDQHYSTEVFLSTCKSFQGVCYNYQAQALIFRHNIMGKPTADKSESNFSFPCLNISLWQPSMLSNIILNISYFPSFLGSSPTCTQSQLLRLSDKDCLRCLYRSSQVVGEHYKAILSSLANI